MGEKILFRLLLFWQRISSSIPADPHRLNFALSSLIPKTHKAPQCFLRVAVYLRKVCLVYINIIETSLSFSSANEKGGNDVYIKGYSHFLLCFCFHFSLSLKVMTSLRRRRSSFDDEPAQYKEKNCRRRHRSAIFSPSQSWQHLSHDTHSADRYYAKEARRFDMNTVSKIRVKLDCRRP